MEGIPKPKIYSQWNTPPKTPLICKDEGLVQQQFKDDGSPKTLMGRYRAGGIDPRLHGPHDPRKFGDFSSGLSFHEQKLKVQDAQDSFNDLPSHIRAEFNNDPGELLAFVGDEKNRKRAEELGLVERSEPSDPPKGTETVPTEPPKTDPPEPAKSE